MAEETLWEGEARSVATVASKGKIVPGRYRLTTRHLVVSTGVARTTDEQIPLDRVQDVDVKQGLGQKVMGTADVVVYVTRSDGSRDSVVMSNLPDARNVRDLINDAAHDARLREQRLANARTYNAATPVVAQQDPSSSDSGDVLAQLRQLGELRDAGVITGEDFEQKKRELLGRI